MNLSAVILTKNEEQNIQACLEALDFVDEKVVIDDFSNDKTLDIAQRLGARVFKKHLNGDFARQRNYGLEKANGRWALFVDADERVIAGLKEEILRAIRNINVVGYRVIRRDFMFGKGLKYGEFTKRGPFGNASILRLGRKGAGSWTRRVHEYWDIRGRVKNLKAPLFHYPHPTLKEFIESINYFSSLHAKTLVAEGKRPNLLKVVVWPVGKFIYNMVFRLGFLDGAEGFVVAFIMSFNSFLGWAKAWINQKYLP
ncbi:hypothetical protein A2115_00290 [Candidatus Woesebacteria bacterium GWA1_41_8]|uniref:Glycosyltransferase 2-like domain-containing protein n=1 Tax=Candidatus Woesebacteria bacterium GWA1_41_8 TaxID=1802471 RepID=A0A1F7WII3_9BACT|nr:MAG: hypothetical protein A2115_00290 [Candidatus Woesebacteria bacterium GWA1_41_8]